jgi:hypothetical protein
MHPTAACLAFSLLPAMVMAVTSVSASGPALSEYGIEGMGVVSTPASEAHASVSPDGHRIVWGSGDREGGDGGGHDLWQATLRDGRWQDAAPLAINSSADDADPMFSPDGHWLYFRSGREGGEGGDDLYRATVLADGSYGEPVNLGPGVNSAGDERAPMPGPDGSVLLFASNGHGGAGGHDVFFARWDGDAFVEPQPMAGGVNTVDDEFDAAWLGNGAALVFARSERADDGRAHNGHARDGLVREKPTRVFVAQCDGRQYGEAEPLALSFNTIDAMTFAPAPDWNKPGELLVTGRATRPRAGKLDIYRMRAPAASGQAGCLD